LTIRGPGIAHIAMVGIDGVDPPVLRALVDANSDFPAGVDTFLVSDDGQVAGLPRSLTMEVS
ncbi:MAG: phosphonate C-P lyase system protein PhnH, partial [Chloroflexi bacterium]|nr:phosphonate C-P lyase system protein PhnH [Chloroflexota bacterium]